MFRAGYVPPPQFHSGIDVVTGYLTSIRSALFSRSGSLSPIDDWLYGIITTVPTHHFRKEFTHHVILRGLTGLLCPA